MPDEGLLADRDEAGVAGQQVPGLGHGEQGADLDRVGCSVLGLGTSRVRQASGGGGEGEQPNRRRRAGGRGGNHAAQP
jgi:hypothetical protein